jgi:hypothetical protein
MSAHPQPAAKLYETTPARMFSLVERNGVAVEGATATVADDLADGVEAIHQIANLAGYSERPRAFIMALASAAHGRASVELFDEDLATLQGCSTKTVQRQRADYVRESRRLRTVDLVGIEEGEFDREQNRHAPSRYTFHLAGTVEAVVADARSDPRWHDLDRKAQRDLLKQAAARAYDLIPDATRKRRNRPRPRRASAVVETHRKAADTYLRKLREVAAHLPEAEREILFDFPGELREWWLKLRAAMDVLCGVDSSQPVNLNGLDGGGGQIVHHPRGDVSEGVEPSPEDVATWDRLEGRLASASSIRTVEVELRPPDGELIYVPDEDAMIEAEAIRAEGCGEL